MPTRPGELRAEPASLRTVLPGADSVLDDFERALHIFDRNDRANVFRDFTFVNVSMCNRDYHAGSKVVTYGSGAETMTVYHTGHTNLVAYLSRLAATWPAPRRVVVLGVSGGGFGALINYDTIRLYWPNSPGYLIDDSGPALADFPLPSGGSPDPWSRWGLPVVLDDLCPGCRENFSEIYPALERSYPNDRKALLSHLCDEPIESAYGLLSQNDHDAGAAALASALRRTLPVLESSRWLWFYAPEQGHTLVEPEYPELPDGGVDTSHGHDAGVMQVSAGVTLQRFLQKQVDDDPTWAPVTPPSSP